MSAMDDRRTESRCRVDQNGLFTLDRHTSMPCLIHDISTNGIKITLPDTKVVPTTFLLMASYLGDKVFRVVWCTDEMIGAMLV